LNAAPSRVATVLASEGPASPDVSSGNRLATALLAGSPRVAPLGPAACRVDARGWDRRGGEPVLVRTLREATLSTGFIGAWVGVGDVAVVADAAAVLARHLDGRKSHGGSLPRGVVYDEASIIVAPGAGPAFLSPLPLSLLPILDELRVTLRTLGFHRIGELAVRDRNELEARFGPDGVQAHRWARAEDDRAFRPLAAQDLPEASLELDGAAVTLEPLLFVLRHLLHRVSEDLLRVGRCASRLSLELHLDGSSTVQRAKVLPARATRREDLLYDLCRAALERAVDAKGRLAAPVREITMRVEETTPPGARQGDLFTGDWRDPMAAAAALSRLRARLGEEAVTWPHPRSTHRPESRNRWRAAASVETPEEEKARSIPSSGAGRFISADGALESTLHLLPEPVEVDVWASHGCPRELRTTTGSRSLIVAEGPERLSGDWWQDPYRREYYRACTEEGELLWLYREWREKGTKERWWLHGFYD
jgi:protein ImuB